MSTDPVSSPRRSWLWYAIGLVLVGGVLLLWLALFIQNQTERGSQLKLEQLRAARELWKQKGPKNYDLLYLVKRGAQAETDMYYAEVRGGMPKSTVLNGVTSLPPEQLQYHSMDGLFVDIERFLQRDRQADSPPTFCRGWFNADDGHLMLFVRRVSGGQEAVEIEVKELKVREGAQ